MKIKTTFWLVFMVLVLPGARSNAETITYLLDISSGIAHYSGGFTGKTEGDAVIAGSFKLHLDFGINYAAFENIDITFDGYSGILLGFDWRSLTGSISGTSIFLSSPNPLGGVDQLAGTFDGTTAELAGTLSDGAYDGFQYDCTISADVIPEPGTLSLLVIGGLAILRRKEKI